MCMILELRELTLPVQLFASESHLSCSRLEFSSQCQRCTDKLVDFYFICGKIVAMVPRWTALAFNPSSVEKQMDWDFKWRFEKSVLTKFLKSILSMNHPIHIRSRKRNLCVEISFKWLTPSSFSLAPAEWHPCSSSTCGLLTRLPLTCSWV